MEFFTIEEIAKLLRVHDRTVRREIERGRLKAVKIGTVWRISSEDFQKYIDEKKGKVT